MENNKKQGGVIRCHAPSTIQKQTFWLLHLAIIVFCLWLTFFNGLQQVGSLLGQQSLPSDPTRMYILFGCALLYWLRHGLTLFYLLTRKIEWGEVLGLTAFMALFEIGLLLIGAGVFRDAPIPLNYLDLFAFAMLLLGSYLNSYSEIQRKWWKQKPSSKGRCYTRGLFRYSMHINYFGDIVLFTGWCLLTQNLWTLALPLFMTTSFIFFHIPGLDAYLSKRYGEEFDAYASKTWKLIPFIY